MAWWRRMKRFLSAIYRLVWRIDEEGPRVRDMMVLDHWERRRQVYAQRNPLLAHGQRYFSQSDEDGLLAEILRRTGQTAPGVFVEYGVGTGLENNTLLLLAQGWRGVWIGAQDLALDPGASKRLRFLREWVTRDNCVALAERGLSALGDAEPDLISMDLDGNDLSFCRQLLEAGRRPEVFIAEYNAKFPPPIRWSIIPDDRHAWDATDYRGASLQSFVDLFTEFDYRLVACNLTGVNAFFVPKCHAAAFEDVPTDIERLYVAPDYTWFMTTGHPTSPRTVASLLRD